MTVIIGSLASKDISSAFLAFASDEGNDHNQYNKHYKNEQSHNHTRNDDAGIRRFYEGDT